MEQVLPQTLFWLALLAMLAGLVVSQDSAFSVELLARQNDCPAGLEMCLGTNSVATYGGSGERYICYSTRAGDKCCADGGESLLACLGMSSAPSSNSSLTHLVFSRCL